MAEDHDRQEGWTVQRGLISAATLDALMANIPGVFSRAARAAGIALPDPTDQASLSVLPMGCSTPIAPPTQAPLSKTFPTSSRSQRAARRAVTSISIFIRGSASPAAIIVAAGRTAPKYWRSTGQHGSKSVAFGRM